VRSISALLKLDDPLTNTIIPPLTKNWSKVPPSRPPTTFLQVLLYLLQLGFPVDPLLTPLDLAFLDPLLEGGVVERNDDGVLYGVCMITPVDLGM